MILSQAVLGAEMCPTRTYPTFLGYKDGDINIRFVCQNLFD